MPSLRERSKRPSYALLAAGLEGLSDEERDSDASQAEGSQAGLKRRSSGGSTDFEPGEASGPRSKGKGTSRSKAKGKGKAKAISVDDDSGSEFEGPASEEEEEEDDMEDEVVDENEAEQEEDDTKDDDHKDDDLVALDSPPPVKSRPRPTQFGFNNAPSHSNQATYVQTEANLIPQQYRHLIVKHAEIIAAPVRGKPSAQPRERDYKARSLDPVILPHGPGTPFVTRLKKEVRGREGAQVIYDQSLGRATSEDQEKFNRQKFVGMALNHISLAAPWQVWQGEGWWPEMAPGHPAVVRQKNSAQKEGAVEQKEKGKPKTAEGWLKREEVRLGLDHVGRYKIDQIQTLSKEEATPYMPKTIDANGKPHMTFNVGLHDKQSKMDIKALDSFPLGQFNPTKSGFVFSAGGPIWGLDWCPFPDSRADKHDHTQYLAVSSMPHIDTKAPIGERWAADSPASIQIWGAIPPTLDDKDNVVDAGNMSCDLILCINGGPVVDLKWMPMGAWDDDTESGIPKLGIIAAVQLDGSLTFYSVPQPEELRRKSGVADGAPLYWRVDKPLLKLELPDAMCSCIDWINGGRVICGTSTGFLVAWDVLDALKNPGLGAPPPFMYRSAAQSFIKSIAIGRDPPEDANGHSNFTGNPVYAVCASHDATVVVMDLRDREQQYEVARSRMPYMSVSWSNQLGCPVWADIDYTPQLHDPRSRYASKSYGFAHHRGPVWCIATSDYHTMTLSCGTDGSVLMSNLQPGWFRRRGGGMIYQRLFEMDYDIFTGEYRILDDFMPEEMSADGAQQKNSNRAKGTSHSLEGNPIVAKSGDWSPHVGVHKVCWNNNNGLGKAGWVASGTASGLGRIDIIRGRFTNGKIPSGLGP